MIFRFASSVAESIERCGSLSLFLGPKLFLFSHFWLASTRRIFFVLLIKLAQELISAGQLGLVIVFSVGKLVNTDFLLLLTAFLGQAEEGLFKFS